MVIKIDDTRTMPMLARSEGGEENAGFYEKTECCMGQFAYTLWNI
jgi:hypothetical protein